MKGMIFIKETMHLKKEIELRNKISEVTSISLESTYDKTDFGIEGNFVVTGSYKDTTFDEEEIEFHESIPITYDFLRDIKEDSINININDFTFEIDGSSLIVDIEYELSFEENKREIETLKIEENIIEENIIEEKIIEERVDEEPLKEEMIYMNSETEENYITYKIHVCSNEDTFDSLALKYNVNINELKELNEIDNITKGLKIIIPTNEQTN